MAYNGLIINVPLPYSLFYGFAFDQKENNKVLMISCSPLLMIFYILGPLDEQHTSNNSWKFDHYLGHQYFPFY